MTPDYDDSELTEEEMLALAKFAFDDADTAGPIPSDPIVDNDDLEDLALSQNPEFQAILEESQRSLENQGGLSTDEVRRRLGLTS